MVLSDAIVNTEPPATFALFGSWGRGKTDVFNRVAEILSADQNCAVVWANPWASGHGDVLSCVAAAIAKNHVREWRDPRELARLLSRVAKVGAVFTSRVVARPLIEQFGIDIDGTVNAVREAAADDELKILLECTPTEIATKSISSICSRAFDGKRVVVLIDDLDRCPPSWQKAMIESLHFLKSIQYPISFVVAIDKDAVFTGAHSLGSSYGDLGALTCKVFDCVYELHDTGGSLVGWLTELLKVARSGAGVSVADQLAATHDVRVEAVRVDSLALGLCGSRELRTPRGVERSFVRVRSLMATGFVTKSALDCTSHKDMFALGAVVAIRDRYPDLVRFVSSVLPGALERVRAHSGPGANQQMRDVFEMISNLTIAEHRSCVLGVLALVNITPLKQSQADLAEVAKYAAAFERASILCDKALL